MSELSVGTPDVLAVTLLDAWHATLLRSKLDRTTLLFERFFTLIFEPLLP